VKYGHDPQVFLYRISTLQGPQWAGEGGGGGGGGGGGRGGGGGGGGGGGVVGRPDGGPPSEVGV